MPWRRGDSQCRIDGGDSILVGFQISPSGRNPHAWGAEEIPWRLFTFWDLDRPASSITSARLGTKGAGAMADLENVRGEGERSYFTNNGAFICPYPHGTPEFDAFERGWVQSLKRDRTQFPQPGLHRLGITPKQRRPRRQNDTTRTPISRVALLLGSETGRFACCGCIQ